MEVRPGYKQTEVGVIPEDWEIKTLGSVAVYTNGKAHEEFISDLGKYIVVNSKFISTNGEVKKYSDHCFSPASKGETLMVMSDVPNGRAIARCFLVDQDDFYTVNQRICALRPHQVNGKLLYYKLNRNPFYLAFDDGVKQTNLRKDDVLSCPLALPPTKAEQEAIVEALSDADALIESLEQLLAKKRQLKQGAMQELLTGKKRLPGFSGHWEVRPFDSVLSRVNVKTHQIQASDYQTTGRWPVVDQGKVPVVGFSDKHDKRFQCPEGGVIVFGDHTCIVKFIDFDFLVGADGTQVMTAKSGQCIHFHALQLQYKGISPTGYNRHFKFLKEREFVVPPPPEQTAIASIFSDMDNEIAVIEEKLTKTYKIKQGMMQELLTGRIRLV